ncbi:MAG: xenobiotic-transporting ATPase [Candidatus Rokubacteria bacterium 13_1_40CM_2_68_8]|nr:MAG: xenobiotic-transporting ATPase [Candidatus Rokubacteria bacterium 13_1_40CM_2_68_8]
MAIAKNRDLVLLRRLLRQAQPYWAHIAGFFLLSLLATPLALLMPLPLKIAVDSGIGSRPLPRLLGVFIRQAGTLSHGSALLLAVGLLVAIALLSQLQAMAVSLLRTYVGEKLLLEFRAELFRHIQRLSLLFHDTKGTVESIYRLQYDAMAIQAIAVDHVIPFISSSFTLVGMLYVTARIAWPLALVALVISPIVFAVGKRFRRGLRKGSREVKVLEKSALAVVQEVLQGLRVVKAFVREESEQDRFVQRSVEGMRARLRLALVEGEYGLVIGLATAVGTGAVLLLGVHQVQSGVLTLGDLLLVMGYMAQFYEPLKTMAKKSATLQSHLASVERTFALLDEAPEVVEKPNARPLVRALGGIVFREVSFAYGPDRPVLHQVSFDIDPGRRVGIAGETGAGKTTLVSLLLRFYDPTSGLILLDGVDLRDYRLEDLRNQFAFVPQETVLFSTSIAENIAYARPEAADAEVIAAAKAASAHEFITLLPQGYDTLVGERGMCLSGGERQRISLARAFLKNAPILILDEPTSSVDVDTEAAIVEAMDRLMRGRTTFLISHRLNALKGCDPVLVVEDGRLVAQTSDFFAAVREASTLGGIYAHLRKGKE